MVIIINENISLQNKVLKIYLTYISITKCISVVSCGYTIYCISYIFCVSLFIIIDIVLRMINTLIYYGLSMSSGSIVGNRYGNFILCSLVEIPALFLVIKIMNNCGRRESQCATLLVCSSLCISIAFIPKRNYYNTNSIQ